MLNFETSAAIKAELARRDLTRAQLASFMGITPGGITRRLRGEQGWTLEDIEKAATFIGVPVSTLVADSDSVAVAS